MRPGRGPREEEGEGLENGLLLGWRGTMTAKEFKKLPEKTVCSIWHKRLREVRQDGDTESLFLDDRFISEVLPEEAPRCYDFSRIDSIRRIVEQEAVPRGFDDFFNLLDFKAPPILRESKFYFIYGDGRLHCPYCHISVRTVFVAEHVVNRHPDCLGALFMRLTAGEAALLLDKLLKSGFHDF